MNEEVRQKGEEALMMLESSVFQSAFRNIDKAFVERWRKAKTTEERERLHMMQRILRDVEGLLVACVQNAATELAQEKDRDNPFAAFMRRFFGKR